MNHGDTKTVLWALAAASAVIVPCYLLIRYRRVSSGKETRIQSGILVFGVVMAILALLTYLDMYGHIFGLPPRILLYGLIFHGIAVSVGIIVVVLGRGIHRKLGFILSGTALFAPALAFVLFMALGFAKLAYRVVTFQWFDH